MNFRTITSVRLLGACLIASTALAGCVSPAGDGALSRRVELAKAEAETRAQASDFSQFLIARYASLTNDPDAAAQQYARVAKARPEDATIAERAVFSALLANEFPLALSIAEALDPEVATASTLPRLTLATEAMAEGDYDAVERLTTGPEAGLFNALMLKSLEAWAVYGSGDAARAELMLMEAASGDPYLMEIVLNLLGLMEVASGQDQEALTTFGMLSERGTIIAAGAASYGELLASRGETEEALTMLTRYAMEAGPNPLISDLAARLRAGEVPDVKRPDIREGAALSIYVPAAALASQSSNDLPGVYYSMALRLDPHLHAASSMFADALDRAGRSGEAIEILKTIPASSPYHVSATAQLAWALHRAGNDDAARTLIAETLAGSPDRDLKIQMGDLLRSLGKDEAAVHVFDEIITGDEAKGDLDWRLYLARGSLREALGEWPLAEEDLLLARTLNPTSAEVLNQLGYSWIDRGVHLEQGLDMIRRALSLRPDSGAITDSLGWAYFKLGDYDQAVIHLERAAELEPGIAEIIDHLGDAYWMTGRRTEARFQWERAITLLEDEGEIRHIRRKLLTGPETMAASRTP